MTAGKTIVDARSVFDTSSAEQDSDGIDEGRSRLEHGAKKRAEADNPGFSDDALREHLSHVVPTTW